MVEPNKNSQESNAMNAAPTSLNLSPEAQRVLEAQLNFSLAGPGLVVGAGVAYFMAVVTTLAVAAAIVWGVSYAIETGNPLGLLSLALLLVLAIPYVTVANVNRLLKARRSQG